VQYYAPQRALKKIPFIGVKKLKRDKSRRTEDLVTKPQRRKKLLSKSQIIKYDGFVKKIETGLPRQIGN
jgi:hypothetical protein